MPGGNGAVVVAVLAPESVAPPPLDAELPVDAPPALPLVAGPDEAPVVPPLPVGLPADAPSPGEPPPLEPDSNSCKPLVSND